MKSSKNKQNNSLNSKKEATWYGYFFFTKHLLILHQILHLLRYYNCIVNDQQE